MKVSFPGWKGSDDCFDRKAEWKDILLVCVLAFRKLRRRKILGHGDVDVLEDFFWRDADHALGRLDEIIALAAGVLTTERIGETETGVELFCFDQEASAVGCPLL